jgi:hypothetical protein
MTSVSAMAAGAEKGWDHSPSPGYPGARPRKRYLRQAGSPLCSEKHGKVGREVTAASCPAEVVTEAEARRAPVLRSSPATEDGEPGRFGVVPLGFATDAPPCGRRASLLKGYPYHGRVV